MTDALTSVNGSAHRDGSASDGFSIDALRSAFDGGSGRPHLSPGTIAEAVRTAVTVPAPDGARILMELTLAGGPWDSAAVARRGASGRWGTWAAAGSLGQMCDQIQWDLGEGPACDALSAAQLVTAPDLVSDGRWPAWRAQAQPLGGRAAVSTRLHTDRILGSLTVYSTRPDVTDPAAIEHLQAMAAHLSALLHGMNRIHHLEEAMRNRGTIGQAIGLLVERYGIAADQAFATLRRISQNENVKMAQVATVLVETGDLPGLHLRGS